MTASMEELEIRLTQAQSPREEIDALNELAWELRHIQAERSMNLSQKAYALSGADEFSEQVYRFGRAASLTTMGFLNQQMGKLDIALSQCFEAMSLIDSLSPSRVTIDVLRIISWIYYFLGDLANALSYGLKALRIAQDMGFRLQEASVIDGLAVIYAATGDNQQALQSHQEALKITRDVGNQVLEAGVLNNMAMNLLEMNDVSAALEFAEKSLDLARQLSSTEQEVSSLDTIGQILIKMGEITKAEEVLREALAAATRSNMELDEAYCLLNLGKIYLQQHELRHSQENVQKALDIAKNIGAQPVTVECYLILSEIFSQQNILDQALEHYKLFHSLHEELNSETSGKRLAALKVAHQVETARRDAEIYRLRNVELQREIEERARVEAELERLATIDSLTNIFNRRHFFKLAQRELERAMRYKRPLTILMIDVDHFKLVNDTYGHATGDQVLMLLAAFLYNRLRRVDILGRYGGEEFSVAMPEINAEQGLQAAERLRQNLEQHLFETSAGPISVTICVGVTSLADDDMDSQGILDKMLNRADQGLYVAKRSGRNRVEVAMGES